MSSVLKSQFITANFWRILMLGLAGLIILSVGQDFVYSRLKDTGFYWYESLLYHTFWLWFFPFLYGFRTQLYPKLKSLKAIDIFLRLGLGILLAFIHLLIFTAVFIGISHLIFSVPHRFFTLFSTVLSNQLFIAIVIYALLPLVLNILRKEATSKSGVNRTVKGLQTDVAIVKNGGLTQRIPLDDILYIEADRPYIAIHTVNEKHLQSSSLKQFEITHGSSPLIRVHRGLLIHPQAISHFNSRRNGDYDVGLKNGKTVRFSRHYRNNWSALLQ